MEAESEDDVVSPRPRRAMFQLSNPQGSPAVGIESDLEMQGERALEGMAW